MDRDSARRKTYLDMGSEVAWALKEYLNATRDYRNGTASEKDVEEKKAMYEAVVSMFKWRFG